jgi:bacillithiol biosynthesis deacetylase BshB1
MQRTHDFDLVAFGAHPDDVELSAGGTVALEVSRGRKVAIVDLTRGQLGTRGTVATRESEADAARAILGVHHRENLGMEDGWFEVDAPHLLRVIEVLRRLRPRVVLANALADRHPDHGRGAELVSRACFMAGLARVETPDAVTGAVQTPWRPDAVYHYIQDRNREPDFIVDITGFEHVKMEAVLAFSSQFYRPGDDGPETPISSPEFLDHLLGRMRTIGRPAGFAYAEGFESARTIGVRDLFALS